MDGLIMEESRICTDDEKKEAEFWNINSKLTKGQYIYIRQGTMYGP